MSALRRFLNLWRDQSLRREFDEELRFHTEMRVEANMRAGMSRADAEAEARRHLGGSLRVTEGMREARAMVWIESLGRDLRLGLRMLWRQRNLAALAVLTLSLGIGANAAMFSLLDAVLFRPLPFPEPDRLVSIVDGFRTTAADRVSPTVPELIDVGRWSRNLEKVSFYDTRDFQINGGQEPARVFAARVEASFLDVLGVPPSLGRLFQDGENLPGRDRVVILTDGLWRRNFGGDPGVVGRAIVVNGAPSTVIGVLPPEFSFDYLAPEPIELYVPFPMNDTYTSRNAEFANVRRVISVARLKPGYKLEWASAEMESLSQALAREHPALYRRGSDNQDMGFFMAVIPLRDVITGRSRPVVMLLFAAVGLVLLIACVNTAHFLLSRSAERGPEVAVRCALGASRARLAGQFLSEALILALAGGAGGLLQAVWLTKALALILPDSALWAGRLSVNPPVLAFTAAVALATVIACGLLPALHFSRSSSGIHMGARGLTSGRSRSRQALIALEVGVSVVLLVATAILVQSLYKLQNTPGGYSSDDVTVMQMRMPGNRPVSAGPQYLERIAAVPGVDSAGIADAPLPGTGGTEFAIEGQADDAATLSQQQAGYRIVSPGYFATLRIPLREGRLFSNEDVAGRPPVAVVNEEMARRFWPGQSPVGRRIRAGMGPRSALMTIVGVAGNVRPLLQIDAAPQIYVSSWQQQEPNVTLLVRGAGGRPVQPEAIKAAVWSLLPDQPVFNIRPLAQIVAQSVGDQRMVARLLGGFALLALFMSATGVYTVVSYLISRRTKEIALRLAIGAKARDVASLVAGQTLWWTLAGLLLGVAGAVASGAALRTVLFGVVEPQWVTVVSVAGLYLLVVGIAICLPVLKALRLDPGSVLRME